ncbi:MAG: GumN family protein [Bacteroidetes bacterium]|nr:GumN family protein [Bacteroidota bacterium]
MPIRKTLIALLLCLSVSQVFAQKKYNSLLWEISGNGLKKPSYLYGTMHVSNKLAFRIGEPFYKALSESDVVATELNPDVWFSDFISSAEYKLSMKASRSYKSNSETYQYDAGMALKNERATTLKSLFQQDLSVINNLMYRISASAANSQEATYIDLYIYKCGKKLGKKVAGVESYQELTTAQANAAKKDKDDKDDDDVVNPKDKASEWTIGEKIEDAYRHADLDQLDSLTHLTMPRKTAEYILYKRNKIMGHFIDSVVKNQRLFIGVGAAHLPGEKGLIEWLRAKGYTLKPLDMGERDAVQRSSLDSLVYPQKSNTYVSADSFYQVDVPGKMLDMAMASTVSFQTGVDMVNGAYYSVARIMSASFVNNESTEQVFQSIDSALYENVPGDILSKKTIELSGYKGFDITNRTRRGDLQRYQIFVTPNEVVMFKLSGTDNFASSSEADKFFSSIRLKPSNSKDWKKFVAPDKTFSVSAPANAFLYYSPDLDNLDNRILMLGSASASDSRFFVLKHSYYVSNYIEKDSLELGDELTSFAKKAKYKLDTSIYQIYKGRPALRATYTTPDKRHIQVYAVIHQLNYYLLGVYYDKDTEGIDRFFNSFAVQNRIYSNYTWYKDTTLRCKVKLPYVPKESSFSDALSSLSYSRRNSTDAEERIKVFNRPGYDEEIHVSYSIYDKYLMLADTIYHKRARRTLSLNYNQKLNNVKTKTLKDGWQIDALVSDTGSTQLIHKRLILKNGTRYLIEAYVDTLLGESEFVKTFFETFTPQDTVIGLSPFVNKAPLYLKDLYSSDTAVQNRAMLYKGYVRFKKEDADGFINAVQNMPKTKGYVDLKVNLLENFAISSEPKVVEFLKSEYSKYSDTAIYQYAILRSLSEIRTPASIAAFKDLIVSEQPLGKPARTRQIMSPIIDSPELVRDYFTDLYPLSSIEDYKPYIIRLMESMVHNKLLSPDQYKDKLPALLTDAKNEYKRSQQRKDNNKDDDDDKPLIECYNRLLAPFTESNSGVKNYFDKILAQGTKDNKIDAIAALLKNNKAVPDTLLESLASDDLQRVDLYSSFVTDSFTDKFPAKYRTAELFAYSLAKITLKNSKHAADDDDAEKDSIILLDKQPTQVFDKKGTAYFYKLKSGDEKFWRTLIIGVQPQGDKAQLHTYNDLYSSEVYYLDKDKTIKEQFDETLDEIVRQKIKYANPYYKHFRDYTSTARSGTY